MVYKPQKTPKGVFRPKQRNLLKNIQNASWPRTPTERLLMDLFDCRAAQFLAVIEALRDTSRRPLQAGLPKDPNDQEVVLELLSAGTSILSGIGGSNEQVCNDNTSLPPAISGIQVSSNLFEMAKTGKNCVSVDAAVGFVKMLIHYEQWEAFCFFSGVLIPVLQSLKERCFKRAELELVLLVAVEPLISTTRSGNLGRDGRADGGADKGRPQGVTAMSDDLLAVAETLHTCVCASAQDVQPERDLVVDIVQLLWAKCKSVLQRTQRAHSLSRLQNHSKWVRILYLLSEVSHSCELAHCDPVAVSEMALRLTAALESRSTLTHRSGRKLVVSRATSRGTRNVEPQTDSEALLQQDVAEQLHTVLEVVERAVESVSSGLARCLPCDGTAVSGVTWLQCAGHTLPSTGGAESESRLSGRRCTSDRSSMTSFHMDLHLELLAVQHRLALKVLHTYPGETQPESDKRSSCENLATAQAALHGVHSECALLEKIGKNRLSKAIFLMQKALLSHKNNSGDSSNAKKLLQEALSLTEKAKVEEKRMVRTQTLPEPSKGAGGKVMVPPPPVLLIRSQRSMTFAPAPYTLEKQVHWYHLYGREATGINLKVRLSDCQLTGTGEEVSTLGECVLRVEGLQPNHRYVFAVAAYDAQGQLVGGTIGETTQPLLASLPLPMLTTWAHLAQAAYQVGIHALVKRACSELWDHFTHAPPHSAEPKSDHSTNCLTETRLCVAALDHASPVLLQLFLTSIFMQTDIHIQKGALYCDVLSDGGPLIWGQEMRLAECERMLVAIEVALRVEDTGAALQAVVRCYGLLVPLIYHRVRSEAAVQVLIKCLVVLQEIPGEFQQKRPLATVDSLLHMVACMTYYVTKVLRLSRQYHMASAVVELGRTLLQEASNAGAVPLPFGPQQRETAQRDTGTDEGSSKQLRALEACSALSESAATSGSCSIASWSDETHNLTGQEDPVMLYSVINSSSLQSAYREVMKFQQKADFLEFAVHLLQRAMREDELELVLQWGKDVLLWLSRQDEALTRKKKISKAESQKPKMITSRADGKMIARGQASTQKTWSTGRESWEVKSLLKHMTILLQQRHWRSYQRQAYSEQRPWRCHFNLSLALAHITTLRRSLEQRSRPGPQHSYSRLDSISFSLAYVGTLVNRRDVTPCPQSLKIPPLPLKAVPQAHMKASESRPRTKEDAGRGVEEKLSCPESTAEHDAGMPRTRATDDGGEQGGPPDPPESLTRAALHFRRAMVLAHRGGHWTSLQWVCRVLWDQAVIVTQLVEQGPTEKQAFPLSLDQLCSAVTPLLVMATDFLLDMMIKLQLWKAYEEEDEEMEASLHFSAPVDDGTLMDLRWLKTLTLHTLQLLFFQGRWETLAHLALLFNNLTGERYTHIVTPLLVHAQWRLLERVGQFGGPPPPQAHFARTERITGEKITCRNYMGKQLLSTGILRGGCSLTAKADPSVSEVHRALMLVSVPLDVEDSLRCFQETLGRRSYALRSFQHSRTLLQLMLAGTQPDVEVPFYRKGQSQSRVEFSMAADSIPTVGPRDLSNEDFSTLGSIFSHPLGATELQTVISSYKSSIKYLQANKLNSLTVLALHDLGNLQFYRGNTRAAQTSWSKALDAVLQSSGVLESWDGVSWKGGAPQDILRQAGVWGCLQGAILSAKIAQYLLTSNIDQRTNCCLLSAILFKSLLGSSLPHPRYDWQYSTYNLDPELIPGLELFSEPARANLNTAVASLSFLSRWLYDCGHFLAALPILSLYQYLVGSVCRDASRTIGGRILKVQVLTELSMFSAAMKEMDSLVQGENIPQPHGSFVAVEKQQLKNFDDSKPLLDSGNLQAVEDLVNRNLSSELSVRFGPQMTRRLALARTQLILALSSSIHSLPEVLGHGDFSAPEVRSSLVTAGHGAAHEDTLSRKTRKLHGLQLDQDLDKITPGAVKALLLRQAADILTSLLSSEQLPSVYVEELETAVEMRLLLSALSLLQGRASLSADWAVSALHLIRDSPLLEDKSPLPIHGPLTSALMHLSPESEQVHHKQSDPDDLPTAVEPRERLAVLWLHCRVAAVRALTAHIPGTAIHPGMDSSAEGARLLKEGILEAEAWGDPDCRAALFLQGALLDTHSGRTREDSSSLLQETVSLLSGRSGLSFRSSLTLASAALQLSDLRGTGGRTLCLLVQKLLQQQLSALGESVTLKEKGQVLSSTLPGMRNIYLPQLPLLAKATMRLGQSLVLQEVYPNSADASQWESARTLLHSALTVSRGSASRDRELEADILYCRGLVESRLAFHSKCHPQDAADAFLEALTVMQSHSHNLRLIRRCYLEMALVYLGQEEVTHLPDQQSSDSPPESKEKKQGVPHCSAQPTLVSALTPEVLQRLLCWTCVRAACQVSESFDSWVRLRGIANGNLQPSALQQLPAFVSNDLLIPCGGFGEPARTILGPSNDSDHVGDIQTDAQITWVHLVRYQAHLAHLHHTATQRVTSDWFEDLCSVVTDTNLALRLAQLHTFFNVFLPSYRGQCCAPEPPITLQQSTHATQSNTILGAVELLPWACAQERQLCIQWIQPALQRCPQDQKMTLLIFAFNSTLPSATGPTATTVPELRCGQLWVSQDRLEAVYTQLCSLCARVNLCPSPPALGYPTPQLGEEQRSGTVGKGAVPDPHIEELQEMILRCLLQIRFLLQPNAGPAVITEVPFEPSRQNLCDLERCFNPSGGAVLLATEMVSWLASLLL